jgi:hypothetical protein
MNSRSLLALALAALVLGCSSSAHSPASRRDSYVQATCMDSVSCCVQRNPGAPEACGLSAAEAASLMAGAKAAGSAAAATDSAAQEWDDSHNAALPDWKRECIRFYGDCWEARFSGPCYDCLRRCEGNNHGRSTCAVRARRGSSA